MRVTPNQSFNSAQFIANFPGTCDVCIPSTMIWLNGNQMWTRRMHGSLCPTSAQQTSSHQATGVTVTAGIWPKIVLQVRWESNNNGYIKMWYDGNKVVEELGKPITIAEKGDFQFRVGLYANDWSNGNYAGNQPFRQIWVDEIAFGTEFAGAVHNLQVLQPLKRSLTE